MTHTATEHDLTSYKDRLPKEVNDALKTFVGGDCVMVRRLKKDKHKYSVNAKTGECHLNVQLFVDRYGGKRISGWLLRRTYLADKGVYAWLFHSVWQTPEKKWLDVTFDKEYAGRDKTIFVPDSTRTADLIEGTSYNNIVIFTDLRFTLFYGSQVGMELETNKVYWCDQTLRYFLATDEHSGQYRWISKQYPKNIEKMCDEYELEIKNGKPIPKPGSRYETMAAFPKKFLFDYSVNVRG